MDHVMIRLTVGIIGGTNFAIVRFIVSPNLRRVIPMPGNPKRVIEKPGAAVSTILRLIIVFILILAGQPEAGVSAQAVLHQPGNGSQLVSTSPQALSASGQPCQWTYYPVVNGKLQSQ
jgi:hypothetical protein